MPEEVKDVKTEEAAASATPDVKPESAPSTEEEIFEGENRSIPYSRFKEKATEARELKKALEEKDVEKEAAVNDTAAKWQSYYEGEINRMQRVKEEDDVALYDEPKKEDNISPLVKKIEELGSVITGMKSERETDKLKDQISSLKAVYPELEDEHVLVVKKTRPKMSLEECAEYSHKYFEDRLKTKYSAMIAKKKEAAKAPIMTADGKLNVPASDKPKNFKDAKKRMIEYAKLLDNR